MKKCVNSLEEPDKDVEKRENPWKNQNYTEDSTTKISYNNMSNNEILKGFAVT